jgi:hypothetical protein
MPIPENMREYKRIYQLSGYVGIKIVASINPKLVLFYGEIKVCIWEWFIFDEEMPPFILIWQEAVFFHY